MCATCGTDTAWDAASGACKAAAHAECVVDTSKPFYDPMTGACVENADACTMGQLKEGSANECMACAELQFWSAEQKACVE